MRLCINLYPYRLNKLFNFYYCNHDHKSLLSLSKAISRKGIKLNVENINGVYGDLGASKELFDIKSENYDKLCVIFSYHSNYIYYLNKTTVVI